LIRQTAKLNTMAGRKAQGSLAYMTMEPGWVGAMEVDALWFRNSVGVVFGYHTNFYKTSVQHPLACPSTNGHPVHCQECRRCIDGLPSL
jgi:hypothetical protein